MEVIVAALGEIIGAVGNIIAGSPRRRQYDRLPDWISPKDFQRQDKTLQYILLGMLAVLLVLTIAIGVAVNRKK